MNRSVSQLVVLLSCLVALGLGATSGCGGGEQPAATTSHHASTASSGDDSSHGRPGSSNDTQGDLVAPGADTGDDGQFAVQAPDAGAAGGNPGQLGAPPDAGPSPWESAERDDTPQLPPRRPMNAAARGPYHDGVTAAAAGNIAAATSAFQQAASADPNAFKVKYDLGVLADRSGRADQAMDFYRQALRIQPDYERAADGMVAIYIRRGDVPGAIAFIQPIAQQWQRNLALQAIYADALVHANRFDDAVTAARAALHRDERFVPAMLSIVKASLQRSPPRTELARSVLDQALAVDANNPESHYLNGVMLRADNRLGDAINELAKAVQLRPDYPEARSELGTVYLAAGNYDQAISMFQGVTALLPDQVAGWLDLAEGYRAAKQWQQAKTTYDKSIAMQSTLPQAHFGLALMYMAAGENFPGLDRLTALQRATAEFNTYRDQMGPRLARDDQSVDYLTTLAKLIEREQTRITREAAHAKQQADRAAHAAALAAAHPDGGAAPAPPPGGGVAAGTDAGTGAH